jgi:ATP-dependent RNA helicase RhlE
MQLSRLWEAIDVAMADAIVTLRKPDTGADAIAAQTEVIELLGQALDQAGQSGGGGGGGGGQMAMQQMMQMLGRGMGSGAGAGGGGNPQGGGTDQASGRGTGRGDGNTAGERRVDQAGGRDMASVPVEFREALEGYYNAVDKKK